MNQRRMRPEFEQRVGCSAEALRQVLSEQLAEEAAPCTGRVFDDYAILRVRTDTPAFWAPVLHLQCTQEQDESVLHGRFSPSSPVWTMFVAVYILLAIIAVAGASYGGAQWTMGDPPHAFWAVPAAVLAAAFTYGAAFIGQGLGAEEMYVLRSFVDRVVARVSERSCEAELGPA